MAPLDGLIGGNDMYLSIGAAAFAIGVSVVTLRRWAKSGRLLPDHRTLGGHRRYDEDKLAMVFHKNSGGPSVPAVPVGSRQKTRESHLGRSPAGFLAAAENV